MIENIVRPFQTPLVMGTKRVVVQVVSAPGADAGISWGTAGTVPAAGQVPKDETPAGYGFTLELCDDTMDENNRETEDVRVENPDDPSQYIIYKRAKSINFKKTQQKKLVGAIRTETTTWQEMDIWAGTPFGPVDKQDKCKSTFNFKS